MHSDRTIDFRHFFDHWPTLTCRSRFYDHRATNQTDRFVWGNDYHMAWLTTKNNDSVAEPICGGLKPLKEAKLCASKTLLTMKYKFHTMGSMGTFGYNWYFPGTFQKKKTLRSQKTHCGPRTFFVFRTQFISQSFSILMNSILFHSYMNSWYFHNHTYMQTYRFPLCSTGH